MTHAHAHCGRLHIEAWHRGLNARLTVSGRGDGNGEGRSERKERDETHAHSTTKDVYLQNSRSKSSLESMQVTWRAGANVKGAGTPEIKKRDENTRSLEVTYLQCQKTNGVIHEW